jgi:O-antigen ligase
MFLLPAILALVPRGVVPLAVIAGLCAIGVIAADRSGRWPPAQWAAPRFPVAIFGLLLLWGGLSALWAIDPARSLLTEIRLAGLFAAAIVLAAAARSLGDPRRLAFLIIAGAGLGLVVAWCDLGTSGGISRHVTVRPFTPPRLNQIAVWLAILLLPFAALLVCRGRVLLGVAAGLVMGGTVFLLDGTAAKTALALSLPVAALLYLRRGLVARIAAALSVVAVMTAPLTLPLLADDPEVLQDADTVKTSLAHRFYIWDFAGKRIAERPLLGWGLDSSRAIPGGKELIRLDQTRLPLHPHNAPLQVWLELGLPGAVLFAALLGWLWLRIATAAWPPLYAAACGGSLAAIYAILSAGWGIWQEWWLATLALAAFAILAMERAAVTPLAGPSIAEPAIPLESIPQPRRGSRACGR